MTQGTMSETTAGGDTKIMWNSDQPDEVKAARKHFESLVGRGGKGYLAYKAVGADGSRGEQIREFDPDVERIILVKPQAGG